jgi:high affinity Mn2+ porin
MPPRRSTARAASLTLRAAAFFAVFLAVPLGGSRAGAHNPEEPETAPPPAGGLTFLRHDAPVAYWLGGEANSIFQAHPSFPAVYSGANSLRPQAEAAISGLFTVFGGYRPTATTELILDGGLSVGGGLSGALGAAGFTNLDVVRNPSLPKVPYFARFQIHQMIPLGDTWEDNEDRGPISSFAKVPRHRIELRAGKMSTADLFDINPAGSDSHMQFMNWAIDNNGAYDYAADTRGYTYGLVVEYQGPRVEVRAGEMLMPKVANGIDLDWDVATDRADNLEVEVKYSRRPAWRGTLRVLGYWNHAAMGSYADAVAASAASGLVPDIMASRQKGRSKVGFGLNEYQELGRLCRTFARFGWNDGKNESFAYTEIDNTVEIGGDVRGVPWRRPDDRLGVAFVSNGISNDHAAYLRRGGIGFLVGDGPGCDSRAVAARGGTCPGAGSFLDYGRETIVEHYYNFHIWGGAFVAEDVQWIAHPGYNSARGPVWVLSLRGHLEF